MNLKNWKVKVTVVDKSCKSTVSIQYNKLNQLSSIGLTRNVYTYNMICMR